MTATAPISVHAVFAALRRSHLAVVTLALAALLSSQAALALYHCPQLANNVARSAQTPCEQMDPASPALCKAFVHGDGQGLDGKRSAVDFAVALPLLAWAALWSALPARRRAYTQRRAPPRARPPPLWITFGRRRD